VDPSSSSPSVSSGGRGVVSTPSSMPHTRGIDVVAADALAARSPCTRDDQTSRTRGAAPRARDVVNPDDSSHLPLRDIMPVESPDDASHLPLRDDPFVSLTANEKK
jgi:hypothetical protein